ncbi:hypothetical protein [Fulvivirga lutimaris]|uniref:hypothetical protein n=1 Tax=Fulvivirga lutimaris TaxID=1819566 RepID=UPI0012BCDE5E|nr:hypothetical protein [Fulvivirga lutimaris]MTI41084.1 hypothetical protein [Fulvivirga lutimaris]
MYIFDYLGAFYFWIWLKLISLFRNKSSPTFKDIIEGKNRYNEGDPVDAGAYGLKLKMIGVAVTMVILHLIVKSGI